MTYISSAAKVGVGKNNDYCVWALAIKLSSAHDDDVVYKPDYF